MNHIYRRIWSTAKRCWIVASELAAPRGKQACSGARRLGTLVAASGALLLAGAAHAVVYTGCSSSASGFVNCLPFAGTSSDSMFRPYATFGSNNTNSLMVGAGAHLNGNNSFGFGHGARVEGNNNVVFGYMARTYGVDSVAFGYNASANGGHAIALGANSFTGALGATAVGNDSSATRVNAIAIGSGAVSQSENSVALGANSWANESNTVSVGDSSLRRRIVNVADGRLSATSTDAVTGKQLYKTNQDVGNVKSLADAAQSTANTARTTANTAKTTADTALAAATSGGYAVASGTTMTSANRAQAAGTNALAAGAGANASGGGAVALGGGAKVSTGAGVSGIAIGSGAQAGSPGITGAVAIGGGASALHDSTALGYGASATVSGSVALGLRSVASEVNTVSVGSSTQKRRVVNVEDARLNSASSDAVTGRQLNTTNSNVSTAMSDASSAKTAANTALTQVGTLNGLLNQVSASGNVRVGEKNSGTVLDVRNSANANRKLTGVADGVVSASSYEAVNGGQLNATNDKVTKVEGVARSAGEDAAVAKTDAAKALTETAALGGLVAQVSATGNMRLGEKNSGATLDVRNSANANRKISGVADGTLSASSAEAVSGRQLHATNSRISDLENADLYVSVGTDSFSERADAALLGVAIGDSAKAGAEGATALGGFARALSKNSVAVGRGAGVSGGASDGFAMGAGAQVHAISGVAIGAGAVVEDSAVGSLALGADSGADEAGIASFGNATTQRRLTNVARGTADHNATTVSQLKDSLATLGGSAGMDASGNIVAPTYAVQGGTQNTVEGALMALDGAVITAGRRADKVEGQLSSIFQESPSARADGMNQIALNGVNGMVLTNLADGRVAPGSRDAVTGNQLYAAEQKISQNRNDLETMRKEREMGEQAMRGLDASGPIDFGGARLTGVADGSITADSNDAITGRQLFGVSDRVSKIESQGRFLKINTDELSEDAFAGFLGVAIGDSATTGVDGGTALGAYSAALGINSVALGRGSYVEEGAVGGFAVGAGSQVSAQHGIAIGSGAKLEAGADWSLALGAGSQATEANTVSFGSASVGRRLVNIANGTADHDAATIGQLRGALSALGSEVDANGNIVGPSFNVQGQSQSTVNAALEALDGAVVSTTSRVNQVESQLRSVFQETPSVRADGTPQLTLAGANGMVISNVANGLIAAGSRDAVNGGQLHSMQQQLNGRMDGLEQRIDDQPQARAMAAASTPSPSTEEIAPTPENGGSPQIASTGEGDKPAPQPKSKQGDTPKPQVDTADLEKMLARANEYTDGAISTFERRLDKMDKRFNRMVAMSSAQSAMAMNTAGLATYNRLGAGVGYSEGESAMAVGYQRVLNEKGSATFSLNGAFTNSGERSMGVGVGIGW